MNQLLIEPRYCGPPDSANGGYFAGLLARQLFGPVEVTLRLPPPLNQPLGVAAGSDTAQVLDGDRVVAQARTAQLELDVPDPVSLADAQQASRGYVFRDGGHMFPGCFVCGTDRAAGDGLRIFPGPVGDVVACTWTPDASLADADGVLPEILWSALDCPTYFGALARGDATTAPTVLGRITADVRHRPAAGAPLIVQGWGVAAEGRRCFAGSAVFTADGRLCAAASAIWVRLAS